MRALISRLNLARLLLDLDEDEMAYALSDRVLTEYSRHLGPRHPKTLSVMGIAAAALEKLGRTAEATALRTGAS
jgi:hypothetical protein